MVTDRTGGHAAPLARLDEWEDSLLDRYSTDGSSRGFRDFDHPERAGIREFYRLNHRHQTFDFAAAKREEFSRHD
ncbi:MAG: inositol oxygenase, partial [Acidobacteriota bacterium]|nr:inositol oxygenase [Acidobacteriota bacterium]